MKTCTKCGETKSLDLFSRRSGGYKSWCKACHTASQRKTYAKNPEKALAWNREYRAGLSEEKRREISLRQNGAHRSKESFRVSRKDLRRLLSQPCAHAHLGGCAGQMEVDHILPRDLGGRHAIGNLQMLCRHHNAKKGKKFEFIAKK